MCMHTYVRACHACMNVTNTTIESHFISKSEDSVCVHIYVRACHACMNVTNTVSLLQYHCDLYSGSLLVGIFCFPEVSQK